VIKLLITLSEKCINNGISEAGREFLTTSTLIGFNKGEGDVRPIAIGDVFRRIIGKVLLLKSNGKIKAFFGDIQQGVATKRGGENIIHCVKDYYDEMSDQEGILQVDICNAFNCIERNAFLEVIA